MNFVRRKSSPYLRWLNSSLYDLPVPTNLSLLWNFGSMLGLSFVIQFFTGMFLACYYVPDAEKAFNSVIFILRDVELGWLVRNLHASGATVFFGCIYVHIARGIYYHSYHWNNNAWWSGCMLYVLLIIIAFTGYVLPWGQMSYWGTTVITNLLSVVPYVGDELVHWVWGGPVVGNNTLKRFYVFHTMAPYLMLVLIVAHVAVLHETGSSNPLSLDAWRVGELVRFHSFYTAQDMLGFFVFFSVIWYLATYNPYLLFDCNNWSPADPLKTPAHIQPEWYFLFAYTILRSIPSKAGGVVALVASVMLLFIMPLYPKPLIRGAQFDPFSEFIFWVFVAAFIVLTYVGSGPVEYPYNFVGAVATGIYFSFFVVYPMCGFLCDSVAEEIVKASVPKWRIEEVLGSEVKIWEGNK